jgi:hypothetical protein
VVLIAIFVIAIAAQPRVRPYWPLLVLAAAAAALPFLLVDNRLRSQPLPLHVAHVGDGARLAVPSLRASAISLPKAAARGDENDDAVGLDVDEGYVAIADGASSSFRAAEWARLLCATFVEQRALDELPSSSWLAKANAAFRESGRTDGEQGMDWWSSEAAERGAHAAFVGLAVLREDERLRWRAAAVGDSVLVHLRTPAQGQPPIVTAFPLAHSAAFPQNPTLLSSAAVEPPAVAYIEGQAAIGDVWLLMTDELARWALRGDERGEPRWVLLTRGTPAELADVVAAARAANAVADDDMTVVRCEVVDGG